MKKIGAIFIGVNFLISHPVNASYFVQKRRSFDCQSDKKVTAMIKKINTTLPEFEAKVTSLEDEKHVSFFVKKNFILKNELKSKILTNEKTVLEPSNSYLTVQGDAWALAIAPEKKRASLYSMNPDVNEVPMFCLSLQ